MLTGGTIEFVTAGRDDDAAVRTLLRRPFDGRVSLSMEREPDASFAAAVEGDRCHVVLARDRRSGRIVGMGSRSVRTVWLGGAPVRMGYLGQLRRDPALRQTMRLLGGAFEAIERSRSADETSFDLTSIVADNLPARRLLERGLPGVPTYRPVGEVVTTVLPVRRSRRRPADVGRGTPESMPEIAACLERHHAKYRFAPRWTLDELSSPERCRDLRPEDFFTIVEGDRVVACLARWDQRRFKQIRVHGYGGSLAGIRPWLDGALRVGGRPGLPPPGRELPLAYLSHVAVDEERPDHLARLVDAARRDPGPRIDRLAIGLAARHPLLAALPRPWGTRHYRSTLYLVYRADAPPPPEALKGALPHVEIATL